MPKRKPAAKPNKPVKPKKARKAVDLKHAMRTVAVDVLGLPEPLLDHKFMLPERKLELDLAWPDLRLAVECQGGVWGGGRGSHGWGTKFEGDCEKDWLAQLRGWFVVKVTTKMIRDGRAAMMLEAAYNFTLSRHRRATNERWATAKPDAATRPDPQAAKAV
jgi:hypothetical protein